MQYKRASVVDTFFYIQTVLLQAVYCSHINLLFDLEKRVSKILAKAPASEIGR